jgi:hypothetical protein
MNQIDIDKKRKRTETLVKVGLLCVAAFFFAPIAATVVTGLVGLIVAGSIGCGVIFFAPWVAQKAGNLRLRLITAEAAKNPIQTLQGDLRDKTIALDNRKTAIENLNGQIRTFSDRVDAIADKYGKNDPSYVKLSGDLADLKRVYVDRCKKWNEAHKQLGLFGDQIDRAKMIWDAGLAAASARESSGLTEGEFYAKLKSDTAFDAIQNNYNTALASLDTALDDGKTPEQVTDAEVVVDAPMPKNKH